MAPKAAKQAAQKKAKKQKKMLIVLGVLLVVALVFGVMTLSSLGKSPQAAAGTTPNGSGANPNLAAEVIPGITTPATTALGSFAAFGRKDPFNDGGPNQNAGTSSKPKTTGSKSSKPSQGTGKGSKSSNPPVPLTGAVISINGTTLSLALGATFGHAPGLSGVALFRLMKLTQKTATVGVVGTQQQWTLHVRRPLTLEQNGGWRYTLILQPIGSAAPMTVAPTTTTTTTTTTP